MATQRKKILFLQHAGSPGGSNMSLLFTLQGLDWAKYSPTVALVFPSTALKQFYEDAGIPVVNVPETSLFRHTTAGWGCLSRPRTIFALLRNLVNWRASDKAILRLLAREKPDLVHLNSVTLAPVAFTLLRAGVPFVWHVREAPVRGYFGLRYAWLRKLLIQAGDRVIFISEADRRAWVGHQCGQVVHNFVDFQRFHPRVDLEPMRTRLGLEADGTPTLLYLGGFAEIKGIFILLEALRLLKEAGLHFRCLMPGCVGSYQPPGMRGRVRGVLNRLGFPDAAARAPRLIKRYQLESYCHLLPFEPDIPGLLAASDCLVFPSTQPHFARPVVEAAAMGKPVVASDLDGVSELVEPEATGLLVPANDAGALAAALQRLAGDAALRERMGARARQMAEMRFDSKKQIKKIADIYEQIVPSSAR